MAGNTEGLDPTDSNVHLVYIPSAVFVVICPILTALRVWARLRRGGKMGADDYVAIVALVFVLLLMGALVAACQYGMGQHFALLDPHTKYETMKWFYVAQVVYKAAINLTKCCIILLYLRIFSKVRWFRWACWGLLVSVAIYCCASVIATIFQCAPIQKAFDKTMEGKCIDNSQFWYANAGFSIATDVIILLLPMPLVYQLQVPMAQKIALMAVFGLGIFVVVTSCLRITSLDILATTPDTTYDIENVMWTIIEPNVAVVCACLPILRPFIVKLIPMLKSKGYGSGAYGSGAYGNTYGSKSRNGGNSQVRDRKSWVELGGAKSDAIDMSAMERSNSTAGSQESILVGNSNDTRARGGHSPEGSHGIQKTIEYTVQYSNKT